MPRTRSCVPDAGSACPGGIIAIALLLYAPEAPAWSGELGVQPHFSLPTRLLPHQATLFETRSPSVILGFRRAKSINVCVTLSRVGTLHFGAYCISRCRKIQSSRAGLRRVGYGSWSKGGCGRRADDTAVYPQSCGNSRCVPALALRAVSRHTAAMVALTRIRLAGARKLLHIAVSARLFDCFSNVPLL